MVISNVFSDGTIAVVLDFLSIYNVYLWVYKIMGLK